MAYFQLGDLLGYQDMNEVKQFWAADTAPNSPETGEIWLDTSIAPGTLKRYSGSAWENIGTGSFIRSDANSTMNANLTMAEAKQIVFASNKIQEISGHLYFDVGSTGMSLRLFNSFLNIKDGGTSNIAVISPGKLLLNGALHVKTAETNLVNTGVYDTGIASNIPGMLYLKNSEGGNFNGAIFSIGTSETVVSRESGNALCYDLIKDTAGKINVYVESNTIKIQNLRGIPLTVSYSFQGMEI